MTGLRSFLGLTLALAAAEDTLVLLYEGDERLFGPYWDVEARFLIFQPLVTLGPDGRIVPALARERDVMWDRIRAGRYAAAIRPYFHAPAGHLRTMGGEGPIGYSNPEMTRLLRELVATVDPPEQDSLYREISELVRRDLPVTLLFPRAPTYVVHRRVKGLESPYRGDPLWHAEDLWIEEEGS